MDATRNTGRGDQVSEATDKLSEIISRYTYDEEVIQVNDLDSWDLEDLQDALSIIDNEVADRCNRAIDENF